MMMMMMMMIALGSKMSFKDVGSQTQWSRFWPTL